MKRVTTGSNPFSIDVEALQNGKYFDTVDCSDYKIICDNILAEKKVEELPSSTTLYGQLWKIENILGDEYDLNHLRKIVEADKEKQVNEKDLNTLRELLLKYFDVGGDCYYYCLTRNKGAFSVGTMTFDDFVEFNKDIIDDIIYYIKLNWAETYKEKDKQ